MIVDVKKSSHLLMQVFSAEESFFTKLAASVGAAAIGFLTPIWPFIALVFVLSGADLYTGWRKNRKSSGTKINSKGLGYTVEKLTLYALAILLAELLRMVFGLDSVWGLDKLTYAVAGLIAWREFVSNIENISAIVGWDLASMIKEKIQSFFK